MDALGVKALRFSEAKLAVTQRNATSRQSDEPHGTHPDVGYEADVVGHEAVYSRSELNWCACGIEQAGRGDHPS